MNSILRKWVFLFAPAVGIILYTQQVEAQDYYCPLQKLGTWNGVTQYYAIGHPCSTAVYRVVTSLDSNLTVGATCDCVSPNQIHSFCGESSLSFLSQQDSPVDPGADAIQTNYVRKSDGTSNDYTFSHGFKKPWLDETIMLTKGGVTYYFRVLSFTLQTTNKGSGKIEAFSIGQELDPSDHGTISDAKNVKLLIPNRNASSNANRHHYLSYKSETSGMVVTCYVSSVNEILNTEICPYEIPGTYWQQTGRCERPRLLSKCRRR